MNNFETYDLQRLVPNLIFISTISSLNPDKHQLRVKLGEGESAWLPWPAKQGRNYTRWEPLKVGQQLILGCPSGDPAQAVVIGQLYSEANHSPSSDPNIDLIEFSNGDYIRHNITNGDLEISVSGTLTLKARRIDMKKA